jgi:TRAP-type C4-dicarboxylate transport system permease small subunit
LFLRIETSRAWLVIDNIPMLIVVMALTLPIAMLAIRLAERAMKKSAEALN